MQRSATWNECEYTDDKSKLRCIHCLVFTCYPNISKFEKHLNYCKKYQQKVNGIRTGPIDEFVERSRENAFELFKQYFFKCVIDMGLPFRLYDNFWFNEAMNVVQIKMPKSTEVRTKNLDQLHNESLEFINREINGSLSLNLSIDGWENVNHNHLLNISLTTPKVIYYKSIDPAGQRQTAQYIGDSLISIVNEIGPKKVTSISTDNAAVMIKSLKNVNEIFKWILPIRCTAHIYNLFFKDLIGSIEIFKEVFQATKLISSSIMGSSVLLGEYTLIINYISLI
jgi:hypothetical protein